MEEITVKEMIEMLKDCDESYIVMIGDNKKITNVTECLKENRVSFWCKSLDI